MYTHHLSMSTNDVIEYALFVASPCFLRARVINYLTAAVNVQLLIFSFLMHVAALFMRRDKPPSAFAHPEKTATINSITVLTICFLHHRQYRYVKEDREHKRKRHKAVANRGTGFALPALFRIFLRSDNIHCKLQHIATYQNDLKFC